MSEARKKVIEVVVARAEEVFSRLREGESLPDIADSLGVWPKKLRDVLGSHADTRDGLRAALAFAEGVDGVKKPERAAKGATRAILEARVEEILELISEGALVARIAADLDVGKASISEYLRSTPELARRYDAALLEQGHALAESVVTIADEFALDAADVKRNELRARTRQWLAGVRNPTYAAKGLSIATAPGAINIDFSTQADEADAGG